MYSSPFEPVAQPAYHSDSRPPPSSVPPHLRHLPFTQAIAASVAEFDAQVRSEGFEEELRTFLHGAGVESSSHHAEITLVDDTSEISLSPTRHTPRTDSRIAAGVNIMTVYCDTRPLAKHASAKWIPLRPDGTQDAVWHFKASAEGRELFGFSTASVERLMVHLSHHS